MSSSFAPLNQGRRSDTRAARGPTTVRGIDEDLHAEPEERRPVVEVDDRAGREKGKDGARGGVEVREPGEHAHSREQRPENPSRPERRRSAFPRCIAERSARCESRTAGPGAGRCADAARAPR